MLRTGSAFSEAVESAVRGAEQGTAAELVVVVAARSGTYRDIGWGAGAVAAWIVLLVAIFIPVIVHPLALAIELPLVFAATAWIVHRTPPLLRALTSERRRTDQVDRAAAQHFLEEAVHGTRARTGLLVYLSLLEERVALIPDLALDGRIPAAVWSEVRWSETGDPGRPRTVEDVVRGIASIGRILGERIPADPGDVNEAPDAPRILP